MSERVRWNKRVHTCGINKNLDWENVNFIRDVQLNVLIQAVAQDSLVVEVSNELLAANLKNLAQSEASYEPDYNIESFVWGLEIVTIYAKRLQHWIHIFWLNGKTYQTVTKDGELVYKYVIKLGLGPFYHPEFQLMTYPAMPCLQCYEMLNYNSWAEHDCQGQERQNLDKLIKYDQDFRMR